MVMSAEEAARVAAEYDAYVAEFCAEPTDAELDAEYVAHQLAESRTVAKSVFVPFVNVETDDDGTRQANYLRPKKAERHDD